MTETVVIVGGGQAGAQVALTLRHQGFAGSITIVGAEPYAPYDRPPLSKDFLAGKVPRERLFMRAETFYAEQRITLRLNETVTAIDRAGHILRLAGGDTMAYDKLVLATGGRVRPMECPGAQLPGIHYLRGIDDVEGFRDQLTLGAKVVLVGGGYIGLETAAVAVSRGCNVTVIEAMDRVLERVTAPEMSAFYTEVHRGNGVDIQTGMTVTSFTGGSRISGVKCGPTSFDADLVVVGIGIIPNDDLARAAGLDTAGGIMVDDCARTADPDIYAAGDCTNHPSALYGGRHRVESVGNAVGQGKTAALAILGKPQPFNDVPWFWSDQYDLKLQMTGLARPGDQTVLRGDQHSRKFSLCYLRDGVLTACHAVNLSKDALQAKPLIAARARPDPARLADATITFKDLG